MTRSPQELAQTVDQWPWPSEHHDHCDTRSGHGCDCYMRHYVERRAALDDLVARAEAGERAWEALRDYWVAVGYVEWWDDEQQAKVRDALVEGS